MEMPSQVLSPVGASSDLSFLNKRFEPKTIIAAPGAGIVNKEGDHDVESYHKKMADNSYFNDMSAILPQLDDDSINPGAYRKKQVVVRSLLFRAGKPPVETESDIVQFE